MNKRTFMKLLTAAMAVPPASRAFAWAAAEKLKNWAGNIEYGTERLYPVSSLQQVRD
jgi:alditol oxidase